MVVPLVRFFSDQLKPSAGSAERSQAVVLALLLYAAIPGRHEQGRNGGPEKHASLASGAAPFDNLSTSVDSSLFTKTWRINSTGQGYDLPPRSFRPKNLVSLQPLPAQIGLMPGSDPNRTRLAPAGAHRYTVPCGHGRQNHRRDPGHRRCRAARPADEGACVAPTPWVPSLTPRS